MLSQFTSFIDLLKIKLSSSKGQLSKSDCQKRLVQNEAQPYFPTWALNNRPQDKNEAQFFEEFVMATNTTIQVYTLNKTIT